LSRLPGDLRMAGESKTLTDFDLEQMKKAFQEAGKNCVVMPSQPETEVKKYAEEHDSIAVLESRILDIEEWIDGLESRKRSLENVLRWGIEEKASDKASGLTNETKRKIAYEMAAEDNDELQTLYGEIRIFRREVRELQIELDNERRGFQLLIMEV